MSGLPNDSDPKKKIVEEESAVESEKAQEPQEKDPQPTDEPPKGYKVGPGKPPLHTRFKSGERSRNPDGRPLKVRPSLSTHQRLQDVARALSQPLRLNGESRPFNVVNLELIKQAALKGDGVSQRYLDKLDRTNREEIMQQQRGIASEIAAQLRLLAGGEGPAKWSIRTLNELAEKLEQLYLDPNHDPRQTRIRDNARAHKADVKQLLRRKAELKAAGAWPPPGVPDLSDEDIKGWFTHGDGELAGARRLRHP